MIQIRHKKNKYIYFFIILFILIILIIYYFSDIKIGLYADYPDKEAYGNITEDIATRAFNYYKNSHKNHTNKTFPCADNKWICTPQYLACEKGARRYKADKTRWNHPCWKALGFSLEYGHFMQYCYRATGKGDHATFTVKATGATLCRLKPMVIMLQFDSKGNTYHY